MAGKLDGKVIMITGGSTGIGHAAVRRCVADGAAVLIADVNEVQGQQVAAEIIAAGGRALFSLPTWAVAAGGLAPGASITAGGVVFEARPEWRVGPA